MIQPVLTWEFTPLTVHKSLIPAPVFARSFVGYTSVLVRYFFGHNRASTE
ncbi:hypothetical protein [uncultured Sphingobacterium sp.]|nr:hypothetical protein [uncultured Sphingobacterium sp.]